MRIDVIYRYTTTCICGFFSCIINPESTGCGFGTVISPYLFGATASLFDVIVFLHRYIPDQMSGSRLLYNRFDRRQRNHLTDMIYHLPDRQYCGGLILLKMGKVMKKIIPVALCAAFLPVFGKYWRITVHWC